MTYLIMSFDQSIERRALDCIDRDTVRHRAARPPFRAAGITEYLRNGSKLEIAQQMANHESARTTGLLALAS
jgi:hypothetical protein